MGFRKTNSEILDNMLKKSLKPSNQSILAKKKKNDFKYVERTTGADPGYGLSFKAKRRLGRIIVTLWFSCTLLLPATPLAFSVIERMKNANAVNNAGLNLAEYLMQTPDGAYTKLPINENPIAIVLNNLNDEDKKEVIRAINTMDNISTNIDYTILEKDNVSIKNKIYITNETTYAGDSHALGITHFSCNKFTGTINYPIHISIDTEKCQNYISSETGENAICAVTKHELGHTLGFKDLYDEKARYESIMYESLYQETYTPSDEARIRAYYGGEAENVTYDYDIGENDKNLQNATVPAELSSLKDDLILTHKDAVAEIWEPKSVVLSFENSNESSKQNNSEKSSTFEYPAKYEYPIFDERKVAMKAPKTTKKTTKNELINSNEDEMGM